MTPPLRLYFSLSSMPYCFTNPFQSSLLLPTEFIFRLRLQIARITWFRYWYAMWVFLRSNSYRFSSAIGWFSCSQLFFFQTSSSCPVSSLRMNSFPANMTLLLGLSDSLLRTFSASSIEFNSYSSLGFTFFLRDRQYSFLVSSQSCLTDLETSPSFFFLSCSWRYIASSCLVGLQSSSSSDSQSWKYFRNIRQIIQPISNQMIQFLLRCVIDNHAFSMVAIPDALVTVFAEGQKFLKSAGVLSAFNETFALQSLQVPQPFGVFYKLDILFLEEIAEVVDILDELVVVEVASDVQLPQVLDICQGLHELHVFDKLLVELIALLDIKAGLGGAQVQLGLHQAVIRKIVLDLHDVIFVARHLRSN